MKLIILTIIVLLSICYYFLFLRTLRSSSKIKSGNTYIKANKLMIVCHPDDEFIFGSKLLVDYKGWKVVCVTCGDNIFAPFKKSVRQKEFTDAMNLLECQYEIWDYEDNYFNSNWDEKCLKEQLTRLFNEQKYEIVVTHNLNGEYGHKQHKKLSSIIHKLKPDNLYVFDLKSSVDHTKNSRYMERVEKLKKIYSSQKGIVEKHKKYIIHQSYKPANFIDTIYNE